MISYKKLFLMMEEREITKEKLKNEIGISSATMAKLAKNEEVAMSTIQSLCNFFNCQPGAILSYEKDINKNSILFQLREEKDIKLKGGLYHQTQVRLAYNSNHMEGSRLTEDQTSSIYETQTIGVTEGHEKIDDIIETVNHFRCFDYILSVADKELSEDIMKHIHLLLKTGTTDSQKEWFAVGDYKKRPNMIGDMIETTHPSKVASEIKQLLKKYDFNTLEFSTIKQINDELAYLKKWSTSSNELLRKEADMLLQIRSKELKFIVASRYASITNEIYNGYKALERYFEEISKFYSPIV